MVGDYAKGKDTGTIELVLVGDINEAYLARIMAKAKDLLHRKITCEVITVEEFAQNKTKVVGGLLVWGNVAMDNRQ